MKDKLPEGWKAVPLADLITEEQMEAIYKIIKETENSFERVRKLTEYLNTLRDQLADEGALPEFMAYWFEYKLTNKIRQ